MDGGGSQQQSGSSTQVVDLPDWAKPYAKETLGKAAALTDQPYQPYTGGERIAGFDPLQEQAQAATGTMTTAPQLQAATGIAGTAGLGSLMAGQQYGQMATDPSQIQQYMSPYMQSVVDIQKREAQRQADIAATQRGSQAVRAGAFGGTRAQFADIEANRNLAQQMGDIQALGSQKAFEAAQQAQQFGAQLGLTGLQQAGQLAQTLGGLGATQFGQEKDIISMQAAAGKERQALEQQRLSQQYQDFLRQQQFPYQQLGFMSDMIRGIPVGQTATTIYNQPQESLLPSLIGASGAFMSSKYGPFAAHGGEIKYAAGQSVVNPLRSLGEMYGSPGMSVDQLKAIIASPQQSDEAKAAAMRMLGQMQRADSEAQAAATQQVLMDDMARGPARGLDDAASMSPEIDAMYSDDPAMMARGGLTSFQDGGISLGEEYDAEVAPDAGSFWKGLTFTAESAQKRAEEESARRLGFEPQVAGVGGGRGTMTPPLATEEQPVYPDTPAAKPAAAVSDAPVAPVSTEVAGLSALQQREQQLMGDMRKQQEELDALGQKQAGARDWWFNFFANVAKTKTTRGGAGAVIESLANGFAAMPAYEAEQDKIAREERRLRGERNMTMSRLELAMNQGQQQQAIQLRQLADNQAYRIEALNSKKTELAASIAKWKVTTGIELEKLGVSQAELNLEISKARNEVRPMVEAQMKAEGMGLEDFVDRQGEQVGPTAYQQAVSARLQQLVPDVRVGGTGQSTVKKATDLLAAAPQK